MTKKAVRKKSTKTKSSLMKTAEKATAGTAAFPRQLPNKEACLSPDQIDAILKSCSANGVSTFKGCGLELTFLKPEPRMEIDTRFVPSARDLSTDDFDGNDLAPMQRPNDVEDAAEMTEDALQNLMIINPTEYERHILSEDAEDVET